MNSLSISSFKRTIWSYYHQHGRVMPWRTNTSDYYVVVSEIMLQQTQVDRVIPKFFAFIKKFPNWKVLARASTKDVLQEWSGLGYNRRALYLKRIAEIITENGTLPCTFEELCELPGIGPNTAGSILAFAFNIPHPFIETNIRSVFIHFFFKNSPTKIHDEDIMPLIKKSLTDPVIQKNPREWYYALMDYGAHLKKNSVNPSRRSTHHVQQKPFKGSNRELRSKILKLILKNPCNNETIRDAFRNFRNTSGKKNTNSKKITLQIEKNLADLQKEGFIVKKDMHYSIS